MARGLRVGEDEAFCISNAAGSRDRGELAWLLGSAVRAVRSLDRFDTGAFEAPKRSSEVSPPLGTAKARGSTVLRRFDAGRAAGHVRVGRRCLPRTG